MKRTFTYSTYILIVLSMFLMDSIANSQALPSADLFIFSSDIPAKQKNTMLSDLKSLDQMRFKDSDGAAARLFGTALNPENLKRWLSERSRYIVSENFQYAASVKVVSPNFIYPNADLLPYREVPPTPKKEADRNQGKVVTIMTNMGAYIYIQGKKAKNLLSAELPGLGAINILSPRIGIFKVGEGLFNPLFQNDENDYTSFADSIKRLAVYFHEARHSDGNGKSLAFSHSPCPENKGALAGRYGCDRNQNGPYTIEGTFLRSAVDSCRECNRREKEALRNIYVDKFNRVLTEGIISKSNEFLFRTDSTSEACKNLKEMGVDTSISVACNTSVSSNPAPTAAAAAQVTSPEPRPAWLDDQPEFGVAP